MLSSASEEQVSERKAMENNFRSLILYVKPKDILSLILNCINMKQNLNSSKTSNSFFELAIDFVNLFHETVMICNIKSIDLLLCLPQYEIACFSVHSKPYLYKYFVLSSSKLSRNAIIIRQRTSTATT